MQKATRYLYLIPSTLGDTDLSRVIPAYNVDIILSLNHFIVEEERTARRFLKRCGYPGDLTDIQLHVLNEHTPESEISSLLDKSGKYSIGLLSEAGLPAVADPGAALVREAHRMNIKVVPLAGPSSLFLALMASGMNGQNFAFNGYLPVKPDERTAKIRFFEKRSENERQAQIFIEAPYRNNQLVAAMMAALKPSARLCIAVNLTLSNEQVITKSVSEWKKIPPPDLHKQPAVFIIQA